MLITINDRPWLKTLVGLSKRHDPDLSYGDEIRAILDPVWAEVRRSQTPVTGINHVLYAEENEIFCGLECRGDPSGMPELELRRIELDHYAYYRHVGPYEQIPQAYAAMRAEVERLGMRFTQPGLEIYGHWNDDPQQLVTEILQTVVKVELL